MRRKILISSAVLILLTSLSCNAYVRVQEKHLFQYQQIREQSIQRELELQKQLDETIRQKQQLEHQNQELQNKTKDLEVKLASKIKRDNLLAGTKGHCNRYRDIFAQYSWDVNLAIAICQAESGGDTSIASWSDDHGLMQINHGLSIYGEQIYDPAYNIQVAYYNKYLKGGWRHWVVYNTGAYLKHLV